MSEDILLESHRKSSQDVKIRRISPEKTPQKKYLDNSFSHSKNLFKSPGYVDDLSNFIDDIYTKFNN